MAKHPPSRSLCVLLVPRGGPRGKETVLGLEAEKETTWVVPKRLGRLVVLVLPGSHGFLPLRVQRMEPGYLVHRMSLAMGDCLLRSGAEI